MSYGQAPSQSYPCLDFSMSFLSSFFASFSFSDVCPEQILDSLLISSARARASCPLFSAPLLLCFLARATEDEYNPVQGQV